MKNHYILLFLILSACSSGSIKKIAIQPYENFELALVDSIKASIEKTFSFEVEVLNAIPIPKLAYVNIKSPRYRADTLIEMLKGEKSNKFDHVLGLIAKDISTTKKDSDGNVLKPIYRYTDWGVFGLGYCPGPSCIVSTFRLNTSDSKLLMERLKKVCNHELGHNLGLPHCQSNDKCVMKDGAESIKTVDNVNLVLCNSCKSKID